MIKQLNIAPFGNNAWLYYGESKDKYIKLIRDKTDWEPENIESEGSCTMVFKNKKKNKVASIFFYINSTQGKSEIIHTIYHEVIHYLAFAENYFDMEMSAANGEWSAYTSNNVSKLIYNLIKNYEQKRSKRKN